MELLWSDYLLRKIAVTSFWNQCIWFPNEPCLSAQIRLTLCREKLTSQVTRILTSVKLCKSAVAVSTCTTLWNFVHRQSCIVIDQTVNTGHDNDIIVLMGCKLHTILLRWIFLNVHQSIKITGKTNPPNAPSFTAFVPHARFSPDFEAWYKLWSKSNTYPFQGNLMSILVRRLPSTSPIEMDEFEEMQILCCTRVLMHSCMSWKQLCEKAFRTHHK